MIGKIMSEAAHSIIGMLSAKPSDMETRTTNIDFGALLPGGEERALPAYDNSGLEVLEDGRGLEFLDQLLPLANDPSSNGQPIARSIAGNLTGDGAQADVGLPTDNPSSSASLSDMERVISLLQPMQSASARAGQDDSGAPVGRFAANRPSLPSQAATSDIDVTAEADALPKTGPVVDGPKTEAFVDKRSTILTNLPGSVVLNNGPDGISKKADGTNPALVAKPDLDMLVLDKNMINFPKEQNLPGKTALTPVPQDIMSARKIQNPLDLRLAKQDKTETAASRQAVEFALDDMDLSLEKPMKIETKLSLTDLDNRPATTRLEGQTELPALGQNIAAQSGQNITQKPVEFNWNMPQFAERFAAEISDLRVNGDLKKFEINPRNMGRLEVSLVTRAGSEFIQIEAETDAAREVILQNSQAIQDMLKAQGRFDLTLRVDVRENGFAASHSDSMNFSQQDSTGEREEGATLSRNSSDASVVESEPDPQLPSDNSRYA